MFEGGKVPYLLSSRSFYKGPDVLSTASQELFRVLRMELFKDCYHSHNKWRAVDLIGWTPCYHCAWSKKTGINWISWVQAKNQMPNDGENTPTRIDEALGSPLYCSLRHNGVKIFAVLESLRNSLDWIISIGHSSDK